MAVQGDGAEDFDRNGWRRVSGPDIAAWAGAARPIATRAVEASAEAWRCGGTWFVGLDALPNAPDGSVGGVALPWAALGLAPRPLHPAQLSVIRPGYPQPSEAESEAAFRFRRDRDAAHLDGLIAEGPAKRRRIAEPHGWILGLALNQAGADAAPLVLWQGSHLVMRAALLERLRDLPPEDWAHADITDAYQAARKRVFETCLRVVLPQEPGQAVILHRLCLHGVAPWAEGAKAEAPGRMIAYFRPLLPDPVAWLTAP